MRRTILRRSTAALTAVGLFSGPLVAACGGGNSAPTSSESMPAATASLTPGGEATSGASEAPYYTAPSPSSVTAVIGRVTLGKDNFCTWTLQHPEPLVSQDEVQDDGRCNAPEAPVDPWNPANDSPTGIDVLPQKSSGHAATVTDGTVLKVNCVADETGKPNGKVSDANGNADSLWLQIDLGNGQVGYAPDANEGWDAASLLAYKAVGMCTSTPAGVLMQ